MSRKFNIALVAALAGVGVAGAAVAQPQDVEITGSAEQICTLPAEFIATSAFNSTTGTYGAGTWTIPENSITTNTGFGDGPPEVAIRVAGFGVCNTAHTITLTSLNGGLVTGDPNAPAPSGFSRRRAMSYEAHWQTLATPTGGPGSVYGGNSRRAMIANANTPGQTAVANFTVTDTVAPPGARRFDIRMGVIPATNHMIAGEYRDTVTVTLGIN